MATHYKLTPDGPDVSKEEFDAYVAEHQPQAAADNPSDSPDQDEE